jgi:hypothetical protein
MHSQPAKPAAAKCPICGKPVGANYIPFCSKRCADIDLHRWLSGGYAIPAEEVKPAAEDRDEERDRPD